MYPRPPWVPWGMQAWSRPPAPGLEFRVLYMQAGPPLVPLPSSGCQQPPLPPLPPSGLWRRGARAGAGRHLRIPLLSQQLLPQRLLKDVVAGANANPARSTGRFGACMGMPGLGRGGGPPPFLPTQSLQAPPRMRCRAPCMLRDITHPSHAQDGHHVVQGPVPVQHPAQRHRRFRLRASLLPRAQSLLELVSRTAAV